MMKKDVDHRRFLHNMSCRSRTEVHSKAFEGKMIPEQIKGTDIYISLQFKLRKNIRNWLEKENGDIFKIYLALFCLGIDRRLGEYRRFIKGRTHHEKRLIGLLSKTPSSVEHLPNVGVVLPACPENAAKMALPFPTLLFILSHTNETLYIKNKSPLLGCISLRRRLNIRFYNMT